MFSTKDWSSSEKARAFFEIFIEFGEKLVPEKFGPYGQARATFSPHTLEKALQFWVALPPGSLGFYGERKRPISVRVWVHWVYRESKRFNELNLWIDQKHSAIHGSESWLIELARRLYLWGAIGYGYMWHEVVSSGRLGPTLERGLPGIYWANFFGPVYVDFFGREKFLTVPAYHKEELPDGGFLLLTAPSPLDYGRPEVQALQEAIIDHLGRDAFFEKAHPEKPCRAPQFTFEQASLGHPLEVMAYDPASEAIPDPHRFVQEASSLAESLIHRFKGKLDYSAESLKQVDEIILNKSYRRPHPWAQEAGRQLVQELTAYYGEVLCRHLQGRWVVLEGSGGDLHPAIVFTVSGIEQVEHPFTRIDKLWEERVRADGLSIHYMLLQSGEWGRLE
jgi:hypothetical protein